MTATIRRFPLSDHQADTVLANPDLGWEPGTLDEARANRDARLRRTAYPRDWLDAHADYVATGDTRHRDEMGSYEPDDPTGAMRVVGYVLVGALTVFVLLVGIPMYCQLLAWTGGGL